MADVTKLNTEKQAIKELGHPQEWAIYQERRLVRAKRVNGSFEVDGEQTDQGFVVIGPEGQPQGVCLEEFQRRFRPAEDADMRTLMEPVALAEQRKAQQKDGDGDGASA